MDKGRMPDSDASSTATTLQLAAGLELRNPSNVAWDLVSLGEVMLRFDPGEDRISRARQFRVWEGGGEYNVARGVRRCFGLRSSIVTALVDNPVGRLVEDLILQGGVDLSHVRWVPYDGVGHEARNGIYFLERGFGIRGAMGMMDRGHTAISQMKVGQVDWNGIFGQEGVRWFHTGGVMCALSEEAPLVVREAMEAAKKCGTVVSFDCNYRPSLWKDKGGRKAAIDMNRSLMPYVDVLFGHDGDLAGTLGQASEHVPWHEDTNSYGEMAERITNEFTNLKVIATAIRRAETASVNDWAGFAYANGEAYQGIHYPALEILDRVGGGDSFAAGLIYGLLSERGMQWSVDCGVVHGALAMTTPGDSSMATLAEIEGRMARLGAGVER